MESTRTKQSGFHRQEEFRKCQFKQASQRISIVFTLTLITGADSSIDWSSIAIIGVYANQISYRAHTPDGGIQAGLKGEGNCFWS